MQGIAVTCPDDNLTILGQHLMSTREDQMTLSYFRDDWAQMNSMHVWYS